ncbi:MULTISPECIES: hypothetical protein [unclassified Streptomyces]|uniref:hypothetical protein n=1 Tax=unclassified Streptomyces TaxID=2593676 RepID=UPI003D8FCF02
MARARSSKYADFEGLREQAVALRRAGLSRRQIRDRLHIDNNDILNRLLEGEPPPEWTRRPNAKDDLRDKARELRLQGWAYDHPGMIQVFLAWLDLLGVERHRLRYTVMIHETADVTAAEQYWADLVGAARCAFNKTTIKRHNPKTVRKNVGDSYRGCLVVKVHKGADLYRRIEGSWYGIVESAREADQSNRT